MKQPETPSSVAVVGDEQRDAAAVAEACRARGMTPGTWFAACDLNDVSAAVAAGGVRAVVFARLEDYLFALWNGELEPNAWHSLGVPMFIADAPATADDWAAALAVHWQNWRGGHNRRRTIAGAVLSVLAIAAAAGLLWATSLARG